MVNMCARSNISKKRFCANVLFVRKGLFSDHSKCLNKLSIPQILLSFDFGRLKLNIGVIYFIKTRRSFISRYIEICRLLIPAHLK